MKHTEKLRLNPIYNDELRLWGYRILPLNIKIKAMEHDREAQANAQRIVDCWNGCAGIKNPLAVRELLEACKKTLDIINAYSNISAQFRACQILQQAINKVKKEV